MPSETPQSKSPSDVTSLLNRLREGDRNAEEHLFGLVYGKLRRIASRHMRAERRGHTLQTTALVNEAYVKLVHQSDVDWKDRAHFFAVASRVMRRILVDHARGRLADKRGGGVIPLPLDEALVVSNDRCRQIVDLDEALVALETEENRVSKVVEMRFFAGLSVDETAEALRISTRTVKRDWKYGRAWLRVRLETTELHDRKSPEGDTGVV